MVNRKLVNYTHIKLTLIKFVKKIVIDKLSTKFSNTFMYYANR